MIQNTFRTICLVLTVMALATAEAHAASALYQISAGDYGGCCAIWGGWGYELPADEQEYIEFRTNPETGTAEIRFLGSLLEPMDLPGLSMFPDSAPFTKQDFYGPSLRIFEEIQGAEGFYHGVVDYHARVTDDQITLDGRFDSNICCDRESSFHHFGVQATRVSQPIVGDFDENELLDVADVRLLMDAIQVGDNESRFDLVGSRDVDQADLQVWIALHRKTWIGDANFDGLFDSGDLTVIFTAGEYEDGVRENSTWATGDWNADGEFDAGDLMFAFQDGGYGQGRRPRVPGDFDGDQLLDVEDINALLRKVAEGKNQASFDLNADGLVDLDDIRTWVHDLKQTWMADANLDGELNTSDLVQAFQSGKYERDMEALWSEGDWTGDLRFNSSDLVEVFSDYCGDFGCHGPRPLAVPEPASIVLAVWAMIVAASLRGIAG